MRSGGALLSAVLLMGPGVAQAEDLLRLPVGTSPRSLHMRASAWRLAAQDASTGSAATNSETAAPPARSDKAGYRERGIDRLERRQIETDVLAPPAPLSEKVIFRFNLGLGLESGVPSDNPMLSGSMLGSSYQKLRIYGFADTVAGTKDIGVQGLSSYFAAHYRFNQSESRPTYAVPSIFDGQDSRALVRSAYGESNSFFESPALRPLYLRAGRSYHYDLAVIHYEGFTIGYDTPALKLSLMGGQRVSLYGLPNDQLTGNGSVGAVSIRADFYELQGWPLVVFGSTLDFDQTSHRRAGLAYRWNRNILLSSSLRGIDGELSRSDFRLRARLSKVTTVNVQLNNRFRSDWSFGPLQLRNPTSEDTDRRRYLDLGPVLPRSVLSVRYGTVFLRNLDVLLRAGAAYDRRDRDKTAASSFSSSYAELGGAAELRVRRTLRVGSSLASRRYFISNHKAGMLTPGLPDRLPDQLGSTGPTSFWQGGVNLHYSPGARQFSGSAELYGRRYSLRSEFLSDTTAIFRSGGRFSLEAWVMDRIRLKAEYDLTFGTLVMAPELRDLKTLRVLLEGSF